MSNRPLILVNLPVITPLVRLVPKEMYRLEVHAVGQVLVRLNVAQAVCLIPTGGEHIEGDLATDRVCEADVWEGFFELGDHGGADVVFFVVGFVFVTFGGGGVTADGGYVDHAVAEFEEGAAFDGDVEVGNVVEDPGWSC
jgi:hypothetical protein